MLIVNKIQLYNFDKKASESENPIHISTNFEYVGNQYSSIACFFNSNTSILDSKDYKLLTKVFEKLNWNIENTLTINTNTCKSNDFNTILKKFKIKTLFIFGEDEFINSIPIRLETNKSTLHEKIKILKTESLSTLALSDNIEYKKICWEIIRTFFTKSLQ